MACHACCVCDGCYSGIPDYRSPGRPEYNPMTHQQFMQDEYTRRRYWCVCCFVGSVSELRLLADSSVCLGSDCGGDPDRVGSGSDRLMCVWLFFCGWTQGTKLCWLPTTTRRAAWTSTQGACNPGKSKQDALSRHTKCGRCGAHLTSWIMQPVGDTHTRAGLGRPARPSRESASIGAAW